jgi:hypothetical protein
MSGTAHSSCSLISSFSKSARLLHRFQQKTPKTIKPASATTPTTIPTTIPTSTFFSFWSPGLSCTLGVGVGSGVGPVFGNSLDFENLPLAIKGLLAVNGKVAVKATVSLIPFVKENVLLGENLTVPRKVGDLANRLDAVIRRLSVKVLVLVKGLDAEKALVAENMEEREVQAQPGDRVMLTAPEETLHEPDAESNNEGLLFE